MTKSIARDRSVPQARLHTALATVFTVSVLACSPAHAQGFGRAQVHSAQGSTLNVTLPITQLTQEDQRALTVRLAPDAAWSQAGLTPPAPLANMRVQLEAPRSGVPGTGSQRIARITSSVPADASTIDLLLIIATASGERQVQFSVLAPAPGLARPARPTPAAVMSTDSAASASRNATESPAATPADMRPRGTVVVRRTDTLSGVSEHYPVAGANYYQMLVALWQANPGAFIENNMNLVLEGKRLTIPSAAAVRAVDPAMAQRLYNEQLDAHAKYRARIGGSATSGTAVAAGSGDSGRVQSGATVDQPATASGQDRLRLSEAGTGAGGVAGQGSAASGVGAGVTSGTGSGAGSSGEAGASGQAPGFATDQQRSDALALKDASDRVSQVQRNVDDLRAAGKNGGAAGASGANGAAGASGANGSVGTNGEGATASGAGTGIGSGVPATGAGPSSGTPGSGNAAGASASRAAGADAGAAGGNANGSNGTSTLAAAGAAGAAGSSGTAAAAAPGVSGAPGAIADPAGNASSGSSSSASANGTGDNNGSFMSSSGLPAWLTDNLLIILTAVLALIAFVIAWVVRRASARREDQIDSELADDEPSDRTIDPVLIEKRLAGIDLDLDTPPTDGTSSQGDAPDPGDPYKDVDDPKKNRRT